MLNKLPQYIFLSGAAGCGKSFVIKTIFQLITHYLDNQPGPRTDSMRVMLLAPSGKASWLINGVTIHLGLNIPVQQFGGEMGELSADIANTIREKLINVKLLIFDEVSMIGSNLFKRAETRCRLIFWNKSALGVSIGYGL